ncbi:MAG: hypothetical protein LBM19_02010 [Holosporales bacterium]|jgi:hypothetical protein|nr:hypothetical protein [Holosporales bacterium]
MSFFRYVVFLFLSIDCALEGTVAFAVGRGNVNQEKPKRLKQSDYVVLTTPEGEQVRLNTQSDIDALKEEIIELKSLLQGKNKKQEKPRKDKKPQEAEQTIVDQNFKLLEETGDRISELLGDQPLRSCGFEGASDLLTVVKNFALSDKSVDTPDELLESTAKLEDLLPEFANELKKSSLLLSFTKLAVSSPRGLIKIVQKEPYAKPLTQSQAQNILENFTWQLREYVSDEEAKILNDLITLIIRSPFENKPTIPSYFIFTMFSCLARSLQNNIESIEKINRIFSRSFDSVNNDLTKLTEDLDSIEKSDKTAPNTIQFITGKKKAIQDALLLLRKIIKEKRDSINEITRLLKETLKELNALLAAPKPQEIFDHVGENQDTDENRELTKN